MNLYLRGGNALGAMPLVSYAAEASALFANVGGTAAFIAGGLVICRRSCYANAGHNTKS